MNSIEDKIAALVRPNVRALQPYSSARDEAPDMGGQNRIMLDANENSFGGPLQEDFSRYPDPQQGALKKALATIKGLQPEQIFLGNGSDEAIDLLMRAFVVPGQDNIVRLAPTYGMYSVQANIHGAEIRQASLRPDFQPDSDTVLGKIDKHSKLLFLCSPNNPTGACLPDAFVLEMLASFPGLVVLDEAYIDFSSRPSWVAKLQTHPNLVILQTLSKAWGLAGLRVGMAFAHPYIIHVLNNIKYPYNLNTISIQKALEALENNLITANKISQILSQRYWLEAELPKLPSVLKVFPSEANFLLVKVNDADSLYHHLAAKGIVVRNRSREVHCENCLRITVGTATENEQLLAAIAGFAK